VDKGLPSNNLNLSVGTIDLSGFVGDSITAVTFSNSSNGGAGVAILAVNVESVGLGSNYCTAEVNSTGQAASMGAVGSDVASDNILTLTASNLPSNQFALVAVAPNQGFFPGANGTSNGNLCLDFGTIGRIGIVNSGAAGQFQFPVNLTAIPQGAGTVSTSAGQTWNFQAWYRDQVGLGSNFTDGISITFQ
jgi:hypothetical protein